MCCKKSEHQGYTTSALLFWAKSQSWFQSEQPLFLDLTLTTTKSMDHEKNVSQGCQVKAFKEHLLSFFVFFFRYQKKPPYILPSKLHRVGWARSSHTFVVFVSRAHLAIYKESKIYKQELFSRQFATKSDQVHVKFGHFCGSHSSDIFFLFEIYKEIITPLDGYVWNLPALF